MNQAQRLRLLQDTGRTVFSAGFLRRQWGMSSSTFAVTVKRMVDSGTLVRLSRGLYALSENYDIYEVANTLVTPSYVTFNSGLVYHGVAFQGVGEIESAANFGYENIIDGRRYMYYKIKQSLLYDTDGLITSGVITVASPERAILDCWYIGVTPDLDNEEKIHRSRLKALASKYPSRVWNEVQEFLKK